MKTNSCTGDGQKNQAKNVPLRKPHHRQVTAFFSQLINLTLISVYRRNTDLFILLCKNI